MRLVKYIFGLLLLLLAAYSIGWYYLADKIVSEINDKYAGQKVSLKALVNNEEYSVSFTKATSSGFPFALAISLHGWQEENAGTVISYHAPINIGYSLLVQDAYITYSGEIDAAFKPVANNFGATLDVNGYSIKASIPLTLRLINNARKMNDPIEMINYIRNISIASKEVKIFDKQEGELFYDKEYERLDLSFVLPKHYHNLEELLNDIPKEYILEYKAQTNSVKFAQKIIPVSLFYGFVLLPADFEASSRVLIKTNAKTFKEFATDIDIKSEITFTTPKFELKSLKIDFKGDTDVLKGKSSKLLVDSKFHFKEGLFEELFKQYEGFRPVVLATPSGKEIDQEIIYIITNKDAFRFKDLENSDYVMNIDMGSVHNDSNSSIKLNNFSIYSGDSGFKLTHESIMTPHNFKDWQAKGVLLLKNYPSIVEFTSGYIYRFGKFKFLNAEARALYIDVNKTFLKTISDHPASTANDLSLDYDIHSDNFQGGKVGNTQIANILQLYEMILYQKLLSGIDPNGDILAQVKKILPNLDENDPLFKKLLPVITGKSLQDILPKEAQKVIPEKAKDVIEKVLPKNAGKIGKDLLKKLGQ